MEVEERFRQLCKQNALPPMASFESTLLGTNYLGLWQALDVLKEITTERSDQRPQGESVQTESLQTPPLKKEDLAPPLNREDVFASLKELASTSSEEDESSKEVIRHELSTKVFDCQKFLQHPPFLVCHPPSSQEVSLVIFNNHLPAEVDLQDLEAGQLLLKMLQAMKLGEQDYVLLSCADRSGPDEQALEVLAALRPKVVLSFGAMATQNLLGKDKRLSRCHGQAHQALVVKGELEHRFVVYPLFHPDFLLINPNMKKMTWEDMQKIMKTLN